MFLVDSEGMGIRGEAFDFITTSPPAVIAKVLKVHFSKKATKIDEILTVNLTFTTYFCSVKSK